MGGYPQFVNYLDRENNVFLRQIYQAIGRRTALAWDDATDFNAAAFGIVGANNWFGKVGSRFDQKNGYYMMTGFSGYSKDSFATVLPVDLKNINTITFDAEGSISGSNARIRFCVDTLRTADYDDTVLANIDKTSSFARGDIELDVSAVDGEAYIIVAANNDNKALTAKVYSVTLDDGTVFKVPFNFADNVIKLNEGELFGEALFYASPNDLGSWDMFLASVDTDDASILFDILDGGTMAVLQAGVKNGDMLNSVADAVRSIYVRVKFQRSAAEDPKLYNLGVVYLGLGVN